MKNLDQKDAVSDLLFALVLGLLLVMGGWGVYSYYAGRYIPSGELSIASFPEEIGSWLSRDLALSRFSFDQMETDDIIYREYSNLIGQSVCLYVVYSAENRNVSHPPELRHLGEGSTITSRALVFVTDSIKATRLVIEKDMHREMEVFWYKAGDRNTNSYLKQQIKLILDRIHHHPGHGIALIRISTPITTTEEDAFRLIKDFCEAIDEPLDTYIP